jgi:hypothetical protein
MRRDDQDITLNLGLAGVLKPFAGASVCPLFGIVEFGELNKFKILG